MATPHKHACTKLVLDAGPLLSLSPLRGLAETYYTVPQVLDELKDKRAREHFQKLGLSAGVRIEVRAPDAGSLAFVIQQAKKTGDYAVLSHADLCVIALTYALSLQNEESKGSQEVSGSTPEPPSSKLEAKGGDGPSSNEVTDLTEGVRNVSLEEQDAAVEDTNAEEEEAARSESEEEQERVPSSTPSTPAPLYADPSSSSDGEGEWITPSTVAQHKARHLSLLPSTASGSKLSKSAEPLAVGCMTADFAMQNVLLQMGMNLVGLEGKRIERVKTWVLRCHACFKICKDASKKFCPSCGNPTLLRASVTISSPTASATAPAMQIHLKKNFNYKLRGTIYSIPSPKPGSAKTGTGEGLILREDQIEYQRAKKKAEAKREREEARMLRRGGEVGAGGTIGNWMDPDWVPEIVSVGAGGKGRSRGRGEDLPTVGYGRKNPNEKRRRKK